jgi:phosphoglycerate dehydrogenase-like enzyme
VRANGWYEADRVASIRRVRNLTLGLLGMGRIGSSVARKMSGFGMRILAADPFLAARAGKSPVEWVSRERLLHDSDLISIHTPLTPETRGMIGEAAFRSMKPSAILVNTSRGAIVDQDALVRALREGLIAGAALDVVIDEPLPFDSPLRKFENVTLTPHTGAVSEDSFAHARGTVADSVQAILRGYWPPFPVNPEVQPRFPLLPFADLQLT